MLSLRFAGRLGQIELTSDEDHRAALQLLRSRFSTSTTIGAQAFEVAIDDFLVNLFELSTWPEDDHENFKWQRELLSLVESNAADSAVVGARLASTHSSPADVAVPALWTAPLTEFQRRDLNKLLELSHGANFSVPGAGKTRVALATFVAKRDAGVVSRCLVVCPRPVFESWHDEVAICFPKSGGVVVRSFDGVVPSGPTDLMLINYERLPDAVPALVGWLRREPALLVLDEAHRMKRGPAGAWGAACLMLAPYAKARLILTGTPAPNGARDLENLMGFVWPGMGRRTVARAITGNDLRAASKLLRPLYVRTTKAELGLPPVNRSIRRVELPPLHRELYSALLGQVTGQLRGGERDAEALGRILLYLLMAATTPALLAAGATRYEPLPYRVPPLDPPPGSDLATLMRDLPHFELSPKYQETLKIVAQNAALGIKTLVWSTFVRNLTSLNHLLARFSPALVHGGTEDREGELARFRNDSDCHVLLSNPSTLGEGISLHRVCHDAIYIDRDFAAGRFLQSIDRIHRLGLTADTETNVTVLVANETVDDLVLARLEAKLAFMGGVLDDPAVLELADLEEEPNESAGMDATDLAALVGHLRSGATS